jgi:hypothetical protein
MTVPELRALPVGQRIHWDVDGLEDGLDGQVVRLEEGYPCIRWTNGQETVIYPDDDGLAEMAWNSKRVKIARRRPASRG